MKNVWIPVSDTKVQSVWACKDKESCTQRNFKVFISPTFYTDAGTPMCGECGEDLTYSHTEVCVPAIVKLTVKDALAFTEGLSQLPSH
jgi:hypothetical protein